MVTIIISTVQISKLRPQEVKLYAPGYTRSLPEIRPERLCCPTSPKVISLQVCAPLQWGRRAWFSCSRTMARKEPAGEACEGPRDSVFSLLAQLIFWSFLLHWFGSKKQALLRVAFQQAECLVENLFTPCLCFYSPTQPPLLFSLVCKPWALVQKLLAQLSRQKASSTIYLTTGFEFLLSVYLSA